MVTEHDVYTRGQKNPVDFIDWRLPSNTMLPVSVCRSAGSIPSSHWYKQGHNKMSTLGHDWFQNGSTAMLQLKR
jgi:hypothetical protein